jgi:ribose transport system ATP-binding protein
MVEPVMTVRAVSKRPTSGELLIAGEPVKLRSPREGARAGISMIYQELDLVPQLTVEQNLFLGHAPSRSGFVDRGSRRKRATEALALVGPSFKSDARVETLSIANQQLAAIARSLTMNAKVIVMDEPSAVARRANPAGTRQGANGAPRCPAARTARASDRKFRRSLGRNHRTFRP